MCERCGWTSYFLLLFLRWVLREGSVELVTGGDLAFIWEWRDRSLHIVVTDKHTVAPTKRLHFGFATTLRLDRLRHNFLRTQFHGVAT